jgi:AcrR family transcriptional regulator
MIMVTKRKTSRRNVAGRTVNQQELASTRERLIEAAKQHFLEFGLQHASVRAITTIAGVNSSLVRYHFGSKEALYREVVHRTAKRLIEVRLAALERLRLVHADRAIPIPELLTAYSQPIVGAEGDELAQDAAIYLRFFGRTYTEPSDELRTITQSQFTALQLKYIDELARSVPSLSRGELVFRFGLLIGTLTFLGSKTGVIETLAQGRIDATDPNLVVSCFVAAFTALFTAPAASDYTFPKRPTVSRKV